MKKYKLLAVMAAIFLAAAVHADECNSCDPCDNACDLCDPCSDWSVDVDWLYWHLRRCELTYATIGDPDVPSADLSIRSVDLSYDSGFRVALFKDLCDFSVGVRYTRYCYEDSGKSIDLNGEILSTRATNIFFDLQFAKYDYDLGLDVVEVEARYPLFKECDSLLWAFAGFRYASIDQSLKTFYAEDIDDQSGTDFVNRIDTVSEKNDMVGYGLYLGGATHFALFNCLQLYGSASVGTMVAEFDRDFREVLVQDEVSFIRKWGDDCYKLLGNLDFAVGVGYDLCDLCDIDLSLTVGYEFHHWINTLDFILADLPGAGARFIIDRHSEDLGFDGLFIRLSAAF